MSKTRRSWLGLAAVAALVGAYELRLQAADAPPRAANASGAALESYTAPDGETYFAMKLSPKVNPPKVDGHDVVVLFDTSASQTGVYREKALELLDALLAALGAHDRVALSAVDLNAVPLTTSFVAADSPEMKKALVDLRRRVPLGSTDMGGAVGSAVARFAESGDAGHLRSVVYIGDGVTTARVMTTKNMQKLVDALVEAHASVSSYAIGPTLNQALLGALANHTGGMLLVDDEDEKVLDPEAGQHMAAVARSAVVWPTAIEYPASFNEFYPSRTPPLRFDRETIVLGKLAGPQAQGEVLHMTAEMAGRPIELNWKIQADPPSDDYSYLAKVVETARQDGGISLPTVGVEGLAELRSLVNVGAEQMARLAHQALAAGNLDQAQTLVDEAKRLDPTNDLAAVVQNAVEKAASRAPKPAKRPAPEVAATAPPGEAPDGSLVDEVERKDRVYAGFIRTEVKNVINQARSKMSTHPEQAENSLKLIKEEVAQAVELDAAIRSQLTQDIEQALRAAKRQVQESTERQARMEEVRAEEQARVRLNQDLYIKEAKVEQLMARFSALMDEERYRDAEAVADIAEEMAPFRAGLRTAELDARMVGYTSDMRHLRDARHRGFVDGLYTVETSHVPTPDEPPILYPDPEVWQMLTERRKKYKAVDLSRNSPAEAKIVEALSEKTEVDFTDQPLSDVIDYLKNRHEIEIQLDDKALADAGVGSDTTITRNLKGITLRSALRLLLGGLDLTYVIKDEVLMITTKTEAENILSTKVYPVGDLVIPVRLPTGMPGGMGGGGMGGGMGGGFFAVKDDLKLSGKTKKPAEGAKRAGDGPEKPAKKPSGERPDVKPLAGQMGPAGLGALKAPAGMNWFSPMKGRSGTRTRAEPVRIELAEGDDPEVKWNDYFAGHPKLPRDGVREGVRELMKAKRFGQAIAMVNAALRNRQGQPWMYEALGLTMQLANRDRDDIERALMSAVDFTDDPMDVMYIANYMANSGFEERALSLFQQVGETLPNSAEPFVMGLRLAQRLQDIDGIRWSTLGILCQAWPKEHIAIWDTANREAEATLDRLKRENRLQEAEDFEAQINEALVRDCVVLVTWTGDADVDLLVKEPSGMVCSFRNPRTTSGGILLGDAVAKKEMGKSEGASEIYVCPRGFDGKYEVIVRRVWGKLAADKVKIQLVCHYNTKDEVFQEQQLSIKDGQVAAEFELKGGRRYAALPEYQVANAVAGQVALSQQALAQRLNALNDPRALGSYLSGANRGRAGAVVNPVNPFFLQGAVGYMPVISTLPAGARMVVSSAVISADRRYVRVSPAPFFSGITQVNTFNFFTGASGTSNGATGGGGGSGGGGAGGGGFGGFGGGI